MAEKLMRVVAYTGGEHVPSARFRVRQYVPYLRTHGIELYESYSRFGTYPPLSKPCRPFWAGAETFSRMWDIARSPACQLTLLQREMLSRFCLCEHLTPRPRVLDVDDALWLHGGFARQLARLSDAVICGNQFLADWFSRWTRNIYILPTAVDTNRYRPLEPRTEAGPILGWSGTGSGLKYLAGIEESLARVLAKFPEARLRVLSDREPRFSHLPASRVEFVRWSPEAEVGAIQTMTIGLMPLDSSPWSLGKCSYKLLLYMACGLPVVASPVGMNREVLARGECGIGAAGAEDWETALDWLLRNPGRRQEMGRASRDVVVRHYSLDALAPRLAEYLRFAAAQ